METSNERVQFLKERMLLLQTTLPVYQAEEGPECRMVEKEIEYLKNELKRSNYFSYNYLL